jgi:hypothetical protein
VGAYERLRTHVLTGAGLQGTAGLVVLLRQGMAAFRRQRQAALPPVPSGAAPTARLPRIAAPQAALTAVLVNMILPPTREVHR